MTRSQRWRTTVLAGVGFLLLQLGWIFSIAPAFGIDEFDHVLRASSVAGGHWQAGGDEIPTGMGRGDLAPARADVAEATSAACKERTYTGYYNCVPKATLDGGEVLIAIGAARYNPTFYAVVGTAAKPFSGTAAIVAMRVATALLACAFFMLTVWLTVAGARTVWPLLVVLAAALPTTVYSTSVVSPNGLQLVGGLAAWVAVLTLVRGPRGAQSRTWAYGLAALSAAVLANTHTLGLLWVALIATAVALLHGLGSTARALLPRNPTERAFALFAAGAATFELVWLLTSGANDPSQEGTTFEESPLPSVLSGLVLWPLQAIGAVPMRDQPVPLIVYAVVVVILGYLMVTALRRARLRSRAVLTLAAVAMASWAVPAALTVHAFDQIGPAWQGRYGMPFTVGLLVIAGGLIDSSGRRPHRTDAVAAISVVGLVLAQVISQLAVVLTYRTNLDLVAGTRWEPPAPALLVALALVAVGCWIAAVRASATGSAVAAPPRRPTEQEVLV